MSKSSKTNKDIKEEKKQVKKIKKEKKDYLLLRKKAITIGIICLSIVVIELIVMLIMHLVRESKITYIDALYHIENVDNSYYIAAGSSNFKHSRYNNTFLYEYTSEEDKNNVQKIYAEKAKLVKLDKELNVVFESTFKSDYDSCFYDVSKVEDGFIAVGSYIYDKKQIGLKTRDGLIVKYDFDGKVLWSKNYQVLGDTEFKDILVVEDGFIVVGQSIYENMEIGNHPDGGGIIVKYDFDGNIINYVVDNIIVKKVNLLKDVNKVVNNPLYSCDNYTVNVKLNDNSLCEISLHDYLLSMLFEKYNVNYNVEVLKCICILYNTYAYRCMSTDKYILADNYFSFYKPLKYYKDKAGPY